MWRRRRSRWSTPPLQAVIKRRRQHQALRRAPEAALPACREGDGEGPPHPDVTADRAQSPLQQSPDPW